MIYPELPEEEAKKVVEGYHQEAAAAGAVREKDKRSRSASRGRDGPPIKRQRSQDRDRRGDYRRRDHPRDRGWFITFIMVCLRKSIVLII